MKGNVRSAAGADMKEGTRPRGVTPQDSEKIVTLEIRDPNVDALARELADATGEDVETAVVRAIRERLARTGRPLDRGRAAAVMDVFERLARLPVLDGRPPDEIVGFGPDGLPRSW